MKTNTHIVLFLAVIITLVAGNAFGAYSGGNGTAGNPYQIGSVADLFTMAADANKYDKCFILTADINLASYKFTTTVIARDTDNANEDFNGNAFTGTFDGAGYKISNLTIDTNNAGNSYLGLFGKVNGGEIKNLGLENVGITAGDYSHDIGGLVGWNDGTISNCYSTGTVTGGNNSGGLGGLAGSNDSNIGNCHSTAAVTGGDGAGDLGGLVGSNWGSISNCHSTGTISGGNKSEYLGMLVGYNDGDINNCHSTGTISSGGTNYGSDLTFTTTASVATPTFSPSPGTYNNSVNVTISTTTSGATIRYTTNGSDPTSSSTVYSKAITVSSTTTIKAKAFKSGMTDSATATATYTIVISLNNGQSVSNLSGSAGAVSYYAISVPAGQSFLQVKTSGGSGDCDLYVKLGSLPTTSSYNGKSDGVNNNELVTINNPASGTWYVMVRGYSAYSGVTLTATYGVSVLTVKPNKLSYTPCDSAVFSGQLKTSTGTGIAGVRVGIDDSLSMVCTLGPTTDSSGNFTYTVTVPSAAKGVYGLTFYGAPAPTFVAVTVNPTLGTKYNSQRKISLGVTSSSSTLDLAFTKNNSIQIPSATSSQATSALQDIGDVLYNSVGDFVSNPVNDIETVVATGCAVGVWTGVGTIPCGVFYSAVLISGAETLAVNTGNKLIDKSNLSSADKTTWKNALQAGDCAIEVAMLKPDQAIAPFDSGSAGWTCGTAIASVVKDAKNRSTLKIVGLPASGNSTSIGMVIVKKK